VKIYRQDGAKPNILPTEVTSTAIGARRCRALAQGNSGRGLCSEMFCYFCPEKLFFVVTAHNSNAQTGLL